MRVLLICAHPDDEALGAGATIRKLKDKGAHIAVLTLSMSSATRTDDLLARQKISHKILGIDTAYRGNIETMKFGQIDRYEVTQLIESAMLKEQPDILITHSPLDIHNDHRITSALVMEAAKLPIRQTQGMKKLKAIMFMEILSSTDWGFLGGFTPNCYCEVSGNDLESKYNSIAVYDNVIRELPHPRNMATIKSLARIRGAQSGYLFAEAFQVQHLDTDALITE